MSRRGKTREAITGYAFLAPALAGVSVFLVFPILVVVWLSCTQWSGLDTPRFVGLQNWSNVLTDPTLGHSLLVTLAYVALVIPIQTALGLLLAVLLSRGLPGSRFFRVIYVLPWIAAPLALGVVWKWIFAPTGGALNALLGTHIAWLSEPAFALPCIATVAIWSQVGYVALFFMAGLAAIPAQITEAAELDGASAWQTFWRIKVPLLGPTFFFVLVTGIISSFQAFDHVYAMTPSGGPEGTTDVIARRIYSEAFNGSYDLGTASTMALVLFVILVIITLAQQRYFAKRVTYDLS